jgi:hypothetical protein
MLKEYLMTEGVLSLRFQSALGTPFTAVSVSSWLFHARFLVDENRALEELEDLESGKRFLAVTDPVTDGFLPRPHLPPPGGEDVKRWSRVTDIKASTLNIDCLDLAAATISLENEVLQENVRIGRRNRTVFSRLTGAVASENGLFEIPTFTPLFRGNSGLEPHARILLQTDLWTENELQVLAKICSHLGYGCRRSQGLGAVEATFASAQSNWFPRAKNPTHLLLMGETLPGADFSGGCSFYGTRFHLSKSSNAGHHKADVRVITRGSIVPLSGTPSGLVRFGRVLRAGHTGENVRPLVLAQTLGLPVRLAPSILKSLEGFES